MRWWAAKSEAKYRALVIEKRSLWRRLSRIPLQSRRHEQQLAAGLVFGRLRSSDLRYQRQYDTRYFVSNHVLPFSLNSKQRYFSSRSGMRGENQ